MGMLCKYSTMFLCDESYIKAVQFSFVLLLVELHRVTVIVACLLKFGIGTEPHPMTSWVPYLLEYQNFGNWVKKAGSSCCARKKEGFTTFQSLMMMKDKLYQN